MSTNDEGSVPPSGGAEPLPTRRAAEITPPGRDHARWLIEPLWIRGGVGIVGGAPKACKSWLALELATAVASGEPALGRFEVRSAGPALLFCAEDSPSSIRERLAAITEARGLVLAELELHVILASSLRLESRRDQDRLVATIEATRPRLLVLDPFIRLHSIDENNATEVASVLGFLRRLQRAHDLSVLVVHHARKSSGANGVEFRGSSDFRAWSDTNIYVRKSRRRGASDDGRIELTLEHRSAPAPDPLTLRLALEPAPHLALAQDTPSEASDGPCGDPASSDLPVRVLQVLAAAGGPLGLDEVRQLVRARNARVLEVLQGLERTGRVARAGRRWATPRPA